MDVVDDPLWDGTAKSFLPSNLVLYMRRLSVDPTISGPPSRPTSFERSEKNVPVAVDGTPSRRTSINSSHSVSGHRRSVTSHENARRRWSQPRYSRRFSLETGKSCATRT